MNIYHSYIYFKNVSTSITQTNQHHLNFYTFLYSYVLLKNLYGSVSIVCNEDAINLFVKYIPYDNIIITNPSKLKNHSKFWSVLKVNSYKKMKTPFVHVDGDVMLLKNHFNKFLHGNYDILTQSVEPITSGLYDKHGLPPKNSEFSHYSDSYNKSINILKSNDIKLCNQLDYALNCGVFGVKNERIKNEYIDTVNNVGAVMSKNTQNFNSYYASFLEQYILIDFITRKKLKHIEIFDEYPLLERGLHQVANEIGYTHFWSDTKFNSKYLELIKNVIKTKHPDYFKYIKDFERDIR